MAKELGRFYKIYKGKYWVYFGTPEDGFFMSSAKNPAGPWEPFIKYGRFGLG
jgi:hypothetical protein